VRREQCASSTRRTHIDAVSEASHLVGESSDLPCELGDDGVLRLKLRPTEGGLEPPPDQLLHDLVGPVDPVTFAKSGGSLFFSLRLGAFVARGAPRRGVATCGTALLTSGGLR
jgi:hypothetical protein